MAENYWIGKATQNKGALRAATHTPADKKIPLSIIRKDASKPGKLGKEARLAEVLRKVRPGKK